MSGMRGLNKTPLREHLSGKHNQASHGRKGGARLKTTQVPKGRIGGNLPGGDQNVGVHLGKTMVKDNRKGSKQYFKLRNGHIATVTRGHSITDMNGKPMTTTTYYGAEFKNHQGRTSKVVIRYRVDGGSINVTGGRYHRSDGNKDYGSLRAALNDAGYAGPKQEW